MDPMQPQGYLHTKLDVKVLILFILARIDTPLDITELYEVAFQDDSLNYFVFVESLDELVESGHLVKDTDERYSITKKGVEQGAFVEDSLAIPVVQKVTVSINKKILQLRRAKEVSTAVSKREDGRWDISISYRDNDVLMMDLHLMAPSEELAKAMAENLKKNITPLYKNCIDLAIESK